MRRDRCVSLFLLNIRADSYTADAKASCTHKALLVNYRRLFLTKTEGADNQRKFPSRCFPVAANYTCNQRYFGLMINTWYKFHSHHRSIMSWGTIKKKPHTYIEGRSVCCLLQCLQTFSSEDTTGKIFFCLQHLVVKTNLDTTKAALHLDRSTRSAWERNKDVH